MLYLFSINPKNFSIVGNLNISEDEIASMVLSLRRRSCAVVNKHKNKMTMKLLEMGINDTKENSTIW
jgi:hypothetical protein